MMICIIMYKYTFVNSFLNIFANLCILSLVYIFSAYSLCIIDKKSAKTKYIPLKTERYIRVSFLFYALFLHNITFVLKPRSLSFKTKINLEYHIFLYFAMVFVNFRIFYTENTIYFVSHGYFTPH